MKRRSRGDRPTAFAAETLPLFFFSVFFLMAVVRLHHGGMKRARSQSMPSMEALPQACLVTRENAPWLGRILLAIN